jgi:hypothetical protein
MVVESLHCMYDGEARGAYFLDLMRGRPLRVRVAAAPALIFGVGIPAASADPGDSGMSPEATLPATADPITPEPPVVPEAQRSDKLRDRRRNADGTSRIDCSAGPWLVVQRGSTLIDDMNAIPMKRGNE